MCTHVDIIGEIEPHAGRERDTPLRLALHVPFKVCAVGRNSVLQLCEVRLEEHDLVLQRRLSAPRVRLRTPDGENERTDLGRVCG